MAKKNDLILIAATKNKGKLREIARIFESMPYQVLSMDEAGVQVDIEESGSSFRENALIKARAVWNITGGMVLAEDSGLEVDYLDKAPGIYSSRYGGDGATDEDKNRKLIKALEGVPFEERTARFVCCAALILADGTELTREGVCEGYILTEPSGNNGFGYDPVFYVPEKGLTTAMMSENEKDAFSHRGKALKEIAELLKQ